MKQSTLKLSLTLAFGLCALDAHAAVVGTGDRLTINTGIATYDQNGSVTSLTSGSWYGITSNADGAIPESQKTPMSQGTEGIIIGVTQAQGTPTHSGLPYLTDWNRIDAPYDFFGNTGEHFTVSAIIGGTSSGLDFSGWRWSWNGYQFNMGGGAWGAGFSNGIGNFAWDGIYGHSYTLDYNATAPVGDPFGFGGFHFAYHFEGTVQCLVTPEGVCTNNPNTIPIPSAVWLFGAGLLGLVGFVRRRKTT